MTAISADTPRSFFNHGDPIAVPVYQSTSLYEGAFVSINSSGYAVAATDSASDFGCMGVCQTPYNSEDTTYTGNNASGSDGATKVRVICDGIVKNIAAASVTQAWLLKPVYVVDNNTVALAATTTNDVLVGVVVKVNSTTSVDIALAGYNTTTR